jgi:hypothetical protein
MQSSVVTDHFAMPTIATFYMLIKQRSKPLAFLTRRKFEQAIRGIAVGIVEPRASRRHPFGRRHACCGVVSNDCMMC